MKYIVNIKRPISTTVVMVTLFMTSLFMASCDFEYDLPEANSKADETPPSAQFSVKQNETDYLTFSFGNQSKSATDYEWDFGDGGSATTKDASNTYLGEGTFTVTLTASDKLGVTSTYSTIIDVVKPPEPPAIDPEILNGDFSAGQDDWKWPSGGFPGGTTNAFNASSDGAAIDYDGNVLSGKTPGAKYTGSTSAGPSLSSSTRYAHQNITVSPNKEYYIEYVYAIKTDKEDIEGGDRVIIEILDGHYDHGPDAVASSNAGALIKTIGTEANGKGNFSEMKELFTANATGEVCILIYAITKDELYVDNVKVYPFE